MRKLINFIMQSNMIEDITETVTDFDVAFIQKWLSKETITIDDMCDLVYYLQPDARLRDGVSSTASVIVNGHVPPPAGEYVTIKLTQLLHDINSYKKLRSEHVGFGNSSIFYSHIKYEKLHPFSDGNGRSGRLLIYWMVNGDFGPYDFLTWWYIQSLKYNTDRS